MFARPTRLGEVKHYYPPWRGPQSEYIRLFEFLDGQARLAFRLAIRILQHRIAQVRNLPHSAERDRPISDTRGANGDQITTPPVRLGVPQRPKGIAMPTKGGLQSLNIRNVMSLICKVVVEIPQTKR